MDDSDPLTPVVVRSLMEGAERYRSLFTHNPHAVFSLDLQGSYTDVNLATQDLTGYTPAEMRGMSFRDVVAPDEVERVSAEFAAVVAGEPRRLETCVRHRDGTLVEVALVGLPVVVEGEVVGVHGVAEDISERTRISRELREAREAADAANVAKSMFVANMSHELRTPLTTIVATAELLEDTGLTELQARFVQAMLRGGKRLARLIEDILDISRIEAGVLTLQPAPFDPHLLLYDVCAWAREQATRKGLRFDLVVDPGLCRELVGDTLRLQQVLTNLLDNAVKFTEHGFVELSARSAAAAQGATTLQIGVRDSGVGVPSELCQSIFDPFSQADPSATRRHEGAGLGLAICRELVDLMDGELSLTSTLGAGTDVSLAFTLPTASPATG
ncbi:ATP-binding protein [Nocardioides sp. 616]|uniref:PAS domain-containing sensor histidine kinase n=1 Tax=Nocardioides sp. 616 TaxID=2268090 RepID=UPI0013B3D805|nr:ATP-binding protein [Nocardioides sp. 616]